mgnify:CR=1 FL=1
MIKADFEIGQEFLCDDKTWQCTDVGQRTIVAICISNQENTSWFNGPPYAVPEIVFDEYDMAGCMNLNRSGSAFSEL